jgi:hypothetical protein
MNNNKQDKVLFIEIKLYLCFFEVRIYCLIYLPAPARLLIECFKFECRTGTESIPHLPNAA